MCPSRCEQCPTGTTTLSTGTIELTDCRGEFTNQPVYKLSTKTQYIGIKGFYRKNKNIELFLKHQ